MEGNLEQKPGWPLLRKSSLSHHTALEARKMSVFQWVMNLPGRSSSQTPQIHNPDFCFNISEIPPQFTWFSYEVLESSTSHFSSDNLVGKGGYSRVFKGQFPDGKLVAVKVTNSSNAAWKAFSREVDIISSLKHKNIAPLLGVCIQNSELISVYEFMSKGSLADNLHGDEKEKDVVPWEARFKVAVRIADALNYLHSGCSRAVIHRDVKSSNILLSDGFEPRLSDFGIAIWGSSNSSFEDVVGTFGYLAPEYVMYGKVSEKIDVYSFGVVLLELLSGRKPIKGQESLVIWAKPLLESGNHRGILDPKLEANVNEIETQRMLIAAKLCLTGSARLRPQMNQIVKILRGEETMCIDKWTNLCSNEETDVNEDEIYADSSRNSQLILALLEVENV